MLSIFSYFSTMHFYMLHSFASSSVYSAPIFYDRIKNRFIAKQTFTYTEFVSVFLFISVNTLSENVKIKC